MAQKRMFDKAIIDTDKFMDLPMSAKAIYFLLGMEADDEGFVSYKKILRIHGGNEDDVKVLIAKNFLINFPSGVVVITDWQKNNYLDSNRIKQTEYVTEKKQLTTKNGKYTVNTGVKQMFNECSTSIEESSIEESRIYSITPKRIANNFFNNEQDRNEKIDLLIKKNNWPEQSVKQEIAKFISYWTELNSTGKKQRWEMEKTFEIDRRLATWFSRAGKFQQNQSRFVDLDNL